MQNIILKNVTFGYTSDKIVFENVNLNISTNWKLGISGRNGQGKSTLFKILRNEVEFSGKMKRSISFSTFPMLIENEDIVVEQLILNHMEYEDTWKVQVELTKLGVDEYINDRVYSSLSGGEQTKLMLAILFSLDNNFHLIDEPTNHLDAHGRKVVSSYLSSKKGFIVISHDIKFLDECIDHTLVIERNTIRVLQCDMSTYLSNKQFEDEQKRNENDRLRGEIKRLDAASKTVTRFADKKEASKTGDMTRDSKPDRGFIGHKAAKMNKRAKVLEAHMKRDIESKKDMLNNIDISRKLTIEPLTVSKPLITLNNVGLNYGQRTIFDNVSIQINSGNIYRICGVNGSGKSSLLNILENNVTSTSGELYRMSNLIISTIRQSDFKYEGNLESYVEDNKLDRSKITTMLINMGLERRQLTVNLDKWSMGQIKKLQIATSLSKSAHLYIWDEPLNYLDIISRKQIKDIIANNNMTLVIVEHDESLFERLDYESISL